MEEKLNPLKFQDFSNSLIISHSQETGLACINQEVFAL